MTIIDTVLNYLPLKNKYTPSGWTGFNAVCCNDTRGRGGVKLNPNGSLVYDCFNCGFKAGYEPGRLLNPKFIHFLHLLNVPDDTIDKMRFDAIRMEKIDYIPEYNSLRFEEMNLPENTTPIDMAPKYIQDYSNKRNLNGLYPLYWSQSLKDRVIIPFFFDGKIVGYTARTITNDKNRYVSVQQPGYVFNLDRQINRKLTIVTEGPIDAISIDGTAILGSNIHEHQNILLQRLQTEIVLVPDKDEKGKLLIEQALELNWSVSLPDWPKGVKDTNDAIQILGRLQTLYLITNERMKNKLKIQLRMKKW
jgi:hypothetical protein